jgi:hypothetical protein
MSENQMLKQQTLELIEAAAIRAAEKAVENVFLRLGIDPEDKTGVRKLKENLIYLDQRRKSEEDMRRIIKNSATTVISTAVVAGLAWAFVVFKGGLHDAISSWLAK